MTKLSDIRILIWSKDSKYLAFACKSIIGIGLKKIFVARSQDELKQICDDNKIDIALIDTDSNGTGGFAAERLLTNRFPNIFLIYITDPKRITDPIKSIFSEAVAFIVKNNSAELTPKVALWAEVVKNSLKAKEYLNG